MSFIDSFDDVSGSIESLKLIKFLFSPSVISYIHFFK
jgi:hypothetical protein